MSAIGIDVGYGYTKSFAMNNGARDLSRKYVMA